MPGTALAAAIGTKPSVLNTELLVTAAAGLAQLFVVLCYAANWQLLFVLVTVLRQLKVPLQ